MVSIKDIRNADKDKYKRNGIIGILTRRYLACYITKLISKTNLKPNHITIFAFLIVLLSTYLISLAEPTYLIIGAVTLFFSKVLDSVDGQLARVKQVTSKKGAWLDGIFDRLKEALIILAVIIALTKQTASLMPWVYGFFALISVYMLSVVLASSEKLGQNKLKEVQSDFIITKILKKLKIPSQFFALQSDTYLFIIALGVALNQLLFVLWFFIIVINVYWITIFIFTGLKK